MHTIITIFVNELTEKDHIVQMLRENCDDFNVVADAYILSPKPGRLFELLNLLKANNIHYGTHFDTLAS